jgi:outer membrane protein assembly factor BamB
VSVPGAALSFSVQEDGSLVKQRRIASDFSTGYGLATNERGAVVADRDGRLSLFARAGAAGTQELLWQRDPGVRVQSVAWDGGTQIWVTTREGQLLALRSEDGARIWSSAIGGRAEAPAVGDGADVFVATKTGTLQRLAAATGALQWTAKLDGPALHAPLLVGNAPGAPALVVCATWNGTLAAFDRRSGSPLWHAELGSRVASAPVAIGDLVAVAMESGGVHAFTLEGSPAWQVSDAVDGPAVLLAVPGESPDAGARLVAISRRVAAIAGATGASVDRYPEGAAEELRKRFFSAMLEGQGALSEGEKRAAQEREAFALSGLLFGAPRAQAGGIAFGTEEGWVYRFDLSRLRPTFRYRAGLPVAALYASSKDHILVSAGDELFALSTRTGSAQWRRGVGGSIAQLDGDRLLAVLTSDRLVALDALDGTRRWTQALDTDFVKASAPTRAVPDAPSGSWWVSRASGGLQLMDARGGVRDALAVEGSPLPPVALAPSTWLGATREGSVFRFAASSANAPAPDASDAPAASYHIVWQRQLGGALSALDVVNGAALVRFASGGLARVDPESGAEIWRAPLDVKEHYAVADGEHVLSIFGTTSLRVHDLQSGALRWAQELAVPALGVQLRAGQIHWVDRAGGAHRANLESGTLLESRQLGLSLEAAAAAADGFVLQTVAGEVGFAELGAETSVPASEAPPEQGETSTETDAH